MYHAPFSDMSSASNIATGLFVIQPLFQVCLFLHVHFHGVLSQIIGLDKEVSVKFTYAVIALPVPPMPSRFFSIPKRSQHIRSHENVGLQGHSNT